MVARGMLEEIAQAPFDSVARGRGLRVGAVERLRQPGNPATGDRRPLRQLTDAQVEQTLRTAEAGFETWRKLPVAERAGMVRRAAELHRERREELAIIIVREMGKVKAGALGEVDLAADITEYYADQAEVITADQPLTILGEGTAVIRRSPLGVLLGIMPWNFPYYQVARFAAPNLVLGNAIVLKHASQCPESAAAIEAIYRDAGLPEAPTSTSTSASSRPRRSSPIRGSRAYR
jgi:succinate-semialdehyde dehydrogenase/glutarate-semialdehyde dehydrogenase